MNKVILLLVAGLLLQGCGGGYSIFNPLKDPPVGLTDAIHPDNNKLRNTIPKIFFMN